MTAPSGALTAGLRARGVTSREAEVLDALTERLTNAQIGTRLFISARTVETHVASLMVKLGAGDRIALAAFGRTAASSWTATIALPAPLASLANPATFVGREAELDHVRGCWDAAIAGHREVVLVHGEAGIGKTRLTAEFAAEVHAAGAIVLHGRCDEALGVPYDACAEALGPYVRAVPVPTFLNQCGVLAAELTRLLPWLPTHVPDLGEPGTGSPEATRHRLFEAVRQLVDSAAAVAPVAVIVDDLHWAAEPTLLMLRHLIRSTDASRLLVVGTYRDGEPGPILPGVLADLRRDTESLTELALTGLDPAAIGALIALAPGRATERTTERLARTIHAGTDGNPFFAREVLRHLIDTGRDTDGDLDWDRIVVPAAVRDVVGRRVARLSEPTGRFLRVAAVLGAEFDLPVAGEVAAVAGDALLDAFEESTAARLVIEVPGTERATFAHALVRRTLLDQLSGPRRQHLHARAAEAIEARYPDRLTERAAQLAHHLREAGTDPARTVHYLTLAGKAAIAGAAFEDAATHLERGVPLAGTVSERQRGELFAALGEALSPLGRLEEAIAARSRARHEFEAVGDLEAVGQVSHEEGRDLFLSGSPTEGEDILRRGLAALGDRMDPTRVKLLASLGKIQTFTGKLMDGDATFGEALHVASQLGDASLAALVDTERSLGLYSQLRAAEGAEAGLRAAPVLRAAGNLWATADALSYAAFNLLILGRFAESEAACAECVPLAHQHGNAIALVHAERTLGPLHWYRTGDPDALAAAARREMDLGTQIHGGFWNCTGHAWLGTAEFLAGDWDAAAASFRLALDTEPPAYAGLCQATWFLHLAYTSQADEALAFYEARRGGLPRAGEPATMGAWALLCAFVEGLVVLGRRQAPAGWYPLVVEAIKGTGALITLYAPGQLLQRIAAIAATAAGDYDGAEAHYRTAIRQADELPHKFERLESRRFYAGMLTERAAPGDHDTARAHLAEAIAGYTRLGMPRHRDLAAEALADLVP